MFLSMHTQYTVMRIRVILVVAGSHRYRRISAGQHYQCQNLTMYSLPDYCAKNDVKSTSEFGIFWAM